VKARVLVLLAACGVAACGLQEIGGGTGLDLPFLAVVYECQCERDDVPSVLEVCWDDDAGELELAIATDDSLVISATCRPTSRHLGPCNYCCGDGCGRGCNAFNGCYCRR
jgi:hypothetical protein